MVSWLEQQGLKAMHKRTLRTIRAAVIHIEHHITNELERLMATLSESVTRLSEAVTNELAQVRAETQANLDAARAALEAAGTENAGLTEALQAKVSENEALVATIDEAQSRIDALASELESNDAQPEVEPPVEEQPPVEETGATGPDSGDTGGDPFDPSTPVVDNTLPGDLPPDEGTARSSRRR